MKSNIEDLVQVDSKQAIDGYSVDWYLQNLVTLANKIQIEMGLTLVVGGSVVSGTLIGGAKYFELFATEFSAAWPLENKDEMRDIFAENGNIYKPSEAGDESTPPPHFIHLADARVHFPDGSLPSNKGVLWRGKLNAVSGFSLGSIVR